MSKRGQGEGTWRQLPSGRWEYRFRVPGGEAGMTIRRSVTGDTKADARKRAEDIQRAAKQGVRKVAARKVPTLETWLEYWITEVLATSARRSNTRDQYETLLRAHVMGTPIARTKLTDLRPTKLHAAINSTRNTRSGQPLGVSSRRSLFYALTAAIQAAVDDGHLEHNPMDRVERPRRGRGGRSAEMRALTDDQVTALLANTADHRHDALVRAYLLTGMRRAELVALRWDDVDLHNRTITVRHQAGDDDDPTDTKTAAGERVLDIGDELADLLLEHGSNEVTRHTKHTNARTDLVFTNDDGGPIDLRALNRWYSPRAAAAGADTGLHALRHTAISRWLMANIPITVVAEWAGHASPETTLRLYGWAIPRATADYANRVQLISHPVSHLLPKTA